jgi:hypothetical protein
MKKISQKQALEYAMHYYLTVLVENEDRTMYSLMAEERQYVKNNIDWDYYDIAHLFLYEAQIYDRDIKL